MERSESIKELAAALSKFQAQVPRIDLDREVEVATRTGGKYRFRYATFANILDNVRKPMADNGLSFTQIVDERGGVTTVLMHSSGEWMSSYLVIPPVDKGPQATGSAITYTKRYSLSAILGVCADDDDDANAAEGNVARFQDRTQGTAAAKPAAAGGAGAEGQRKRTVFSRDMVNGRMLQRLHDREAAAKAGGEGFNIFAFLDSVYDITPDDIKYVCARLGEYEQENNLPRP